MNIFLVIPAEILLSWLYVPSKMKTNDSENRTLLSVWSIHRIIQKYYLFLVIPFMKLAIFFFLYSVYIVANTIFFLTIIVLEGEGGQFAPHISAVVWGDWDKKIHFFFFFFLEIICGVNLPPPQIPFVTFSHEQM